MNIFLAKSKVTAYLLDKAISLHPNEVASALDKKPEFAKGNVLKSFKDWKKEDLRYISRLFWDDKFNRDVKLGFRGTGVGRDTSGLYHILIYGDKKTCSIMEKKLPFLNQKCEFPISCKQVDEVKFATIVPGSFSCPGGSCILQPSGNGVGVLGAWIKRRSHGMPVGLTNNHVAVECNKHPPGTAIYDKSRNKVGSVGDFIPLVKYQLDSDINYVDLAWIEPENTSIVNYDIGCSAVQPKGEVDLEDSFSVGDREIYLCRNDSTVIKGEITAIVPAIRVGDPPEEYKFLDVIALNIGEEGDSGALILDLKHRIGGMFFAVVPSDDGLTTFGLANKWQWVTSKSQINFII